MNNKYIKCDCCGKRIYFDDEIYYFDGYCGTYCSAECFTEVYATYDLLTEEHVENCMCEVYDDDIIAQKKLELKQQIQELQNQLKQLDE